jgi:hypothetical protein
VPASEDEHLEHVKLISTEEEGPAGWSPLMLKVSKMIRTYHDPFVLLL